MPTFRVYAVQLLHDAKDIEADNIEDARHKAKIMYEKTGELDPDEVIEGTYGIVGDTEFVFKEQSCTDKSQDDEKKSYQACPDCGCTDIECSAWVNVNNDEVSSSDPPNDTAWCPQCSYNGMEGTMKYRHLVTVDKLQPVRYEDDDKVATSNGNG